MMRRANAARVVRRVLRDFDEHFFGPEVESLKAESEKVLALLATRSLEDAGDVRTHLDSTRAEDDAEVDGLQFGQAQRPNLTEPTSERSGDAGGAGSRCRKEMLVSAKDAQRRSA